MSETTLHRERYPVSKSMQELEGFAIDEYVGQMDGVAVEVGGPTERGDQIGFGAYPVLMGVVPSAELIVTNLHNNHENPTITQLIQAQHLPYKAASLDVLLTSYLSDYTIEYQGRESTVHQAFIHEARRCLKQGGLFLMRGMTAQEISYAEGQGLMALRVREEAGSDGSPHVLFWDGLFLRTDQPQRPSYRTIQYFE